MNKVNNFYKQVKFHHAPNNETFSLWWSIILKRSYKEIAKKL